MVGGVGWAAGTAPRGWTSQACQGRPCACARPLRLARPQRTGIDSMTKRHAVAAPHACLCATTTLTSQHATEQERNALAALECVLGAAQAHRPPGAHPHHQGGHQKNEAYSVQHHCKQSPHPITPGEPLWQAEGPRARWKFLGRLRLRHAHTGREGPQRTWLPCRQHGACTPAWQELRMRLPPSPQRQRAGRA